MTLLKIENLTRNLLLHSGENVPLLRHVNLETKLNETTALLQLSGSSTSVLLRILAGQLLPSCGKIVLNGTDITPGSHSNPERKILYSVPSFPSGNENNQPNLPAYLGKRKENFFFSLFSKKTGYTSLSLLPPSFYRSGKQTLKTPQELLPHQHILLSFLPFLNENPALLLIDTLPALSPDETNGRAIHELTSITTGKNIPLLFNTRSPQLAFHLAGQILIFRDEYLLRSVDNSSRDPALLQELLQLQKEVSDYIPLHSFFLHSLLEQQYI